MRLSSFKNRPLKNRLGMICRVHIKIYRYLQRQIGAVQMSYITVAQDVFVFGSRCAKDSVEEKSKRSCNLVI